jgi:putative membrane protein
MLENLTNFAIYFGFAITLTIAFTMAYIKVTPYDECKLILDEGNEAAAIALVGAMIGFALPVASVVVHSVNWVDFAIWASLAAAIQLSVSALITRGMKRFSDLMNGGLKAAGIALAGVHIVVGLLNAASMSY